MKGKRLATFTDTPGRRRDEIKIKLAPINTNFSEISNALNNNSKPDGIASAQSMERLDDAPYGTSWHEWGEFLAASYAVGFDSPQMSSNCSRYFVGAAEAMPLLEKLKYALHEKENEIAAVQSDLGVVLELKANFEAEIERVRINLVNMRGIFDHSEKVKELILENERLFIKLTEANNFALMTEEALCIQLAKLEEIRSAIEKRLAIEMELVEERSRWEAAFNKRP